jgi:polyhydroxybutyrate depolymerase
MRVAAHSIAVLALLAAALLTAGGWGDAAPARSAPEKAAAAAPACQGKRGGRFVVSVRDEHEARRAALVNVPRGRPGPLPVVIALHGAGGNGRFMERYSNLTRVGNRAGFIAVYPDAAGKFWQLTPTGEEGGDDVAVVRGLLDRVAAAACVDAARVYATGVSNGGGLVARLGCEMSDRVAAIAPVAGPYGGLPPCHPDRPVSVLEIHGTEDESVPYAGRPPNGTGSVAGYLAQWYGLDGCGPRVTRRRVTLRVLEVKRPACSAGTSVSHLKVLDGNHAWPGTPLDLAGHDSRLSAADAVWGFFRSRRLAPAAATSATPAG